MTAPESLVNIASPLADHLHAVGIDSAEAPTEVGVHDAARRLEEAVLRDSTHAQRGPEGAIAGSRWTGQTT